MTSTTEHMRVRIISEDGMAHHTQVLNAETNEPLTAVTNISLVCDANDKGGAIWRGSLDILLPRCDITAEVDVHTQCMDAFTVNALTEYLGELNAENQKLTDQNQKLQARIDELTGKTEA